LGSTMAVRVPRIDKPGKEIRRAGFGNTICTDDAGSEPYVELGVKSSSKMRSLGCLRGSRASSGTGRSKGPTRSGAPPHQPKS
jgi:hypothetical protein